MARIVDYTIAACVEGNSRLIEIVKEAIEKGWQPIGGVIITSMYADYVFCQVLVKYEQSPATPEEKNDR